MEGEQNPQDRKDGRGSGGDTLYILFKTILYTFPLSFPMVSLFIPIYPDNY